MEAARKGSIAANPFAMESDFGTGQTSRNIFEQLNVIPVDTL
jgi:hypothetical protein